MPVTGIVSGPDGQPVAGVKVFSQGSVKPDDPVPSPLGAAFATTDAKGRFTLDKYYKYADICLLAVGPQGKLAAVIDTDEKAMAKPLQVTLQPTQLVHMSVQAPAEADEQISRLWSASGSPMIAVWGRSTSARLPPGAYRLTARTVDTLRESEDFKVAAEELTLPTLTLHLTPMAAHFGGTPPTVASLVDLHNQPFQPADYKGRWTLLYFWENGCIPCIEEGFPKLMKFQQAHRQQASRFQLVGVHTRSSEQETTQQVREYVGKLSATRWHQTPAFPMTNDLAGATTTAWGVEMWPTYGLVDPEGKLIRGDLATLEKALGQLTDPVR